MLAEGRTAGRAAMAARAWTGPGARRQGQFDRAAELSIEANALPLAPSLKRQRRVYDPDAHTRIRQPVDRDVHLRSTSAEYAGSAIDTERPVFVVGMPRSGTSLTEQVLASHPRVFGRASCGWQEYV